VGETEPVGQALEAAGAWSRFWPGRDFGFGFSSNPVVFALDVISFFATFALPAAISVAILRYRLYEIDRIISRTLAYTIVTGLLVGVSQPTRLS